MAELSVSPCLFLGIGTNGWRILNELRQLIYEEFGRGGLPCFRYIGIESDSDKKPLDSFLPHRPESYERVNPVYISIADTSVIRRRLNPQLSEDYIPGMAEWLDENLIGRGNKSYKAGAGNSRQAGRLCLWENWRQFTLASSTALDAIRNPDNAVATEKFLKEEYFAKKRKGTQTPSESLVASAPKVYIFGTLCGGTCSGSFIDIAYYISRELGLLADVRRGIVRGVADPEIVGLFTITDLRLVGEVEARRSVANCWAALRELDFFYQKEGRYRARFPDGSELDTATEPFDTLYLESLRNLAGVGFERSDFDGLAQMCAMNLFTEVVAGLASRKNESRVNLRQTAPGYLQPNQTGHVRAFSSFGLSAFWYPKYRIAQAINRHLAFETFSNWLGGQVRTNAVRDQADRDWKELLGETRGSLLGTIPRAQCNVNLPAKIEEAFSQRESDFLETPLGSLDGYFVNFPSAESTLAQRLSSPSGDYFGRMANAEPLLANDLKLAMVSRCERYFREHTCAEVKEYLTAMMELVDKDAQRLGDEVLALSQSMDVSLAMEIEHSLWAKSLGLHKDAVLEYKRMLWDAFKRKITNHLECLRDFFIKKVLIRLRSDISNLQAQLSHAEARLRLLRDTCEREKQSLIAVQPPGHIVTIAAGEQNTIGEDVDLGARRIFKEVDLNSLRRLLLGDSDPLKLLTCESQEWWKSRIDLTFGQFSQAIVNEFEIAYKVRTGSRNRIPDLINRAAPYIEATANFRALETKDTPNFLFCSDRDSADEIVRLVNEKLKDARYSSAFSPLEHFVIFYHEAVGLALSDLAISDRASKLLAELEADPNRIATNFRDRQGEKLFDVKAVHEYQRLDLWLRWMRVLDPEVFQKVGTELAIDYPTTDGLTRHLAIGDARAVRGYIDQYGSDSLIKRFAERLKSIGKPALLERMQSEGKKAQSLVEKEKIDRDHEAILKEVFSKSPIQD